MAKLSVLCGEHDDGWPSITIAYFICSNMIGSRRFVVKLHRVHCSEVRYSKIFPYEKRNTYCW